MSQESHEPRTTEEGTLVSRIDGNGGNPLSTKIVTPQDIKLVEANLLNQRASSREQVAKFITTDTEPPKSSGPVSPEEIVAIESTILSGEMNPKDYASLAALNEMYQNNPTGKASATDDIAPLTKKSPTEMDLNDDFFYEPTPQEVLQEWHRDANASYAKYLAKEKDRKLQMAARPMREKLGSFKDDIQDRLKRFFMPNTIWKNELPESQKPQHQEKPARPNRLVLGLATAAAVSGATAFTALKYSGKLDISRDTSSVNAPEKVRMGTTVEEPHSAEISNPTNEYTESNVEVATSYNYKLSSATGAPALSATPVMVEGGVDATPFAAKNHTPAWIETQKKAAEALLKIYEESSSNRFDEGTKTLIEQNKTMLVDLANLSDTSTAKFKAFEAKHGGALRTAKGLYNVLLSFERAVDVYGKDSESLKNDTAKVVLTIGSKVNNADERFAKALKLKSQEQVPAVPKTEEGPKTGMIDDTPSIEYGEVEIDLNELEENPELAQIDAGWDEIPSIPVESQKTQFEAEMAAIDSGWNELITKQAQTTKSMAKIAFEQELAAIDADWDMV